jgi:hypothetical protein
MPAVEASQRDMSIDGAAGTVMYRFNGDLATLGFLKYDVTNLAYVIRNKGRSAVIGVGGGRDLLSAHLCGFADVDPKPEKRASDKLSLDRQAWSCGRARGGHAGGEEGTYGRADLAGLAPG